MKLLKIIIFIFFIAIALYWIFTRDSSISSLLMFSAGLVAIINGLDTINSSENKSSVYLQCGLGIVLILMVFL